MKVKIKVYHADGKDVDVAEVGVRDGQKDYSYKSDGSTSGNAAVEQAVEKALDDLIYRDGALGRVR